MGTRGEARGADQPSEFAAAGHPSTVILSEESHMTRILIVAALVVSSSLAKAQAVTVTLSEWKVGLARSLVAGTDQQAFRVAECGDS
jgi:hypothetical protein